MEKYKIQIFDESNAISVYMKPIVRNQKVLIFAAHNFLESTDLSQPS